MQRFREIGRANREAALDMVEDAAAGRAFPPETPPKVAAVVRALMAAPRRDPGAVIAATATALEERWADSYQPSDVAIRMASLVAVQREAVARTSFDGGADVAARAGGRFAEMSTEGQEALASDINRGVILSAREGAAIAEDAAAATRMERTFRRDVARDPHETTRRELDRARQQMGIAHDEWREAGERGRVSMLLHVQVPAMMAIAGTEYRSDPSNAEAIAAEARRLKEGGAPAIDGAHGIRANLRLAGQLANWIAPMLDPDVRAMVRSGGAIDELADATRGVVAPRRRHAITQTAEMAA